MKTKITIFAFILIVSATLMLYWHTNIVGNLVSEEAFQSQIHLAFNSYLDGSMKNIEEDAITGESTKGADMQCGLDNFDKSIFKSDYSIEKIEDSKYGGKIGYLTFSNQPNTTFWVWIYNIGDDNNPEYVLKAFCRK